MTTKNEISQENKTVSIRFLNRGDLTDHNLEKLKILADNLWDIKIEDLEKLTKK